MVVSTKQIESFNQTGAICLRNKFDSSWLEKLASGVDKNFQTPGPYSTRYTESDKPGGFYDDYCNWQRIDEYREFIFESPAGEIAALLTESTVSRMYHEHVLVKEPGTLEVTPWHHDLSYYGVDGDQLCSIWLPLDPVPQKACPELMSGSHRSGEMHYPRLFVSHENYANGFDEFTTIPDIDADRDRWVMKWIILHFRLFGLQSRVSIVRK